MCPPVKPEICAVSGGAGVRAHVDKRDQRPGFKHNDWELKGAPLRMEIGPRDLAEGNVVLAQRLGRDEKDTIAVGDVVAHQGERRHVG